MEVEKYDYESETFFYQYFNKKISFLKAGYVGETLGEDNIMEVKFEDLNKDVPVELAQYIRNHVVEASMRKGPLNSWEVKVMKCHARAIRRLYRVKDIDRVYSL